MALPITVAVYWILKKILGDRLYHDEFDVEVELVDDGSPILDSDLTGKTFEEKLKEIDKYIKTSKKIHHIYENHLNI